MTEYKENVWYGWNGGECPVHPKSLVEAVWISGGPFRSEQREAKDFVWVWDAPVSGIIAFRVVKEYREPREFWVFPGGRDVLTAKPAVGGDHYIHVREVVEGGDA